MGNSKSASLRAEIEKLKNEYDFKEKWLESPRTKRCKMVNKMGNSESALLTAENEKLKNEYDFKEKMARIAKDQAMQDGERQRLQLQAQLDKEQKDNEISMKLKNHLATLEQEDKGKFNFF
uniref:Uncharacterized protein n=1 Tax=Ditylenchus dipsaci TaxID=166011 RepID=A0A915EL60_9BILA